MHDSGRFYTKRVVAVMTITVVIALLWIAPEARAALNILHSFTMGADGGYPHASLTLSGSTLYGTAKGAGDYDNGTIFKINTDGTGFLVLHSFTGGADGAEPAASLTLSGSTLYGTTNGGGSGYWGTVFKINTDGGGYKVLYNFTNGADGGAPNSLTLSGSTLYGTAHVGGMVGVGTIFKINTDGTGYQVLYSFTGGVDAGNPWASLILSGSTLYGTTMMGGTANIGAIFKINTDGTGYLVLHSFTGGPGYGLSSVTLSGSTLYGTTGGPGYGTIFRMNIDGTGYQILYNFTGGTNDPLSSLTLSGSTLYGTTFDSSGTIFRINPDGTGYQVLYSFTGGVDGSNPAASVTLSDSMLYGTALLGGADDYGTIFSLALSTPASYYYGQTSESGYFAEPVNTALGNYTYKHTDLKMPGRGLGLEISRSYNSQDSYNGSLGYGWTYTYNMLLQIDSSGNVTAKYPDGHEEGYSIGSNGTFTPNFSGIYNTLIKNADSTYTLTDKTKTSYNFTSAGKLASIIDKNGNTVTLSYTGTNLTSVTGPSGRSLALSYDSNGHLAQIADPLGRHYIYAYDGSGNLASYTDPKGGVWQYSYDSSHEITQITNPAGNVLVKNIYSSGKVTSQVNGRGYTTTFQYDTPSSGNTTITDPLGNVIVHTHDTNYRLTQEKDALGHTTGYSYDANGNRTQVTDKNGNVTKYTYDAMGNVTSKTDALGDVTNITYDANNNPLTRTDALNNTTTYAYDSNGNLIKATDPLGNITTYGYDGYGELAAKTDANSNPSSFSYDSSGNLSQAKDALGDTVSYTYDAAGRKLSQTDPDGNTTTYVYDANDNPISIKDALGHAQSFTYDADNNRTSFTDKNGKTTYTAYDANDEPILITDPLGYKTTIAYDALDRKSSVTDPDGDTTTYSYDAVGNISAVTDPLGHATTFTYDANGNRLASTNPLGKTTQFAYDALNRLFATTDPLGNVQAKAYDALGQVISKTDADGNVTQYQYDALGHLVSAIEANGAVTSYAYDHVGNRTSFTNALGKATSYGYDAVNRLASETDPDGNVKQYGYDAAGNQTSLQKADGAVIHYSFDALNRLSGITYPTGSPTSFAYDSNGNRTGMVDTLGTSSWSYDALNRMLSYTNPFGKEVQYAYDAAGNRLQMTYPGSLSVTYAYDKTGRMLSVTDWLGNATGYQYDAAGNLISASNHNGTTATYAYDDSSRLIGLTNNKSDGSVISGYAYTLDGVGNQMAENRNEPLSPTILDASASFTFDGDNRIQTAGSATFTHDANGNRTAQTGAIAATFTYDYANRLTYVSWGVSYGYDGLGNRLAKIQGAVETCFVLDVSGALPNVIEETDAAGNAISYYVYGLGLVSKILPDGTTYTYHYDSRGSTIAMSDSTGQIVNKYAYTPFGELSGASGSVNNLFCYVGKYGIMEEGAGLLFMRARYYDSVTGRFLSKDPTEGDVTSPQTLDRYVYVLENPVRFIDISGLSASESAMLNNNYGSSDNENNLLFNNDNSNSSWESYIKYLLTTPISELPKDVQNNPIVKALIITNTFLKNAAPYTPEDSIGVSVQGGSSFFDYSRGYALEFAPGDVYTTGSHGASIIESNSLSANARVPTPVSGGASIDFSFTLLPKYSNGTTANISIGEFSVGVGAGGTLNISYGISSNPASAGVQQTNSQSIHNF